MATQDELDTIGGSNVEDEIEQIINEVVDPAQQARANLVARLEKVELARTSLKRAISRLDRVVSVVKQQNSPAPTPAKPKGQQRKRWISEDALGKVRDVFSDPDPSASYTVSEICEITGLSEPTVRQGVGKLSDEHYVYQAGRDSSKTGNPMQYKRAKGV